MKIQISRMHENVTNLGWGNRIGIWVQGCSIGCAGCIAVDTWKKDDERSVEVGVVLDWFAKRDASKIDGVTLSGGEPFEQPEAIDELVDGLRVWRDTTGRQIDLLSYSGMHEEVLRERFWPTAEKFDVLVPEPFQRELLGASALVGSDNQRIVPLSDLGRARYTGEENLRMLAEQRHVIGITMDESFWAVNVPPAAGMREFGHEMRGRVALRRSRDR